MNKRMGDFLIYLHQSNIDVLESILMDAIQSKIEEGWKIDRFVTFAPEIQQCCAIGSLIENESSYRMTLCTSMSELFKLDPKSDLWEYVNAIANGFDGAMEFCGSNKRFFELGERLWNFANELQQKDKI